jgi:hypothetical protein
VDRGLLRPKTQVGWRPAVGEVFLMEGTGETVVFLTHIERRFGVPAGKECPKALGVYNLLTR